MAHRDLSRARNRIVCRLHAVLSDLVPGGFAKEISAAQADQALADIVPLGSTAAARLELAHELLDQLHNIDEQLRSTERRIIRIVAASKTTLTDLYRVGLTVAFGALGHAVGSYDAALTYCRERRQFGKPLVSFQIVQERLVRMLAEVTAMQLICLRVARLGEQHQLRDTIAGLAKMNNTSRARRVIAQARDLLGGNGILLENHVMRHLADIETLHTFEGTETMQTLIVGRDITGVGAFV
jgi:alkylation response protein AidB-like acyl-CoA dehydrogenase